MEVLKSSPALERAADRKLWDRKCTLSRNHREVEPTAPQVTLQTPTLPGT